MSAAIEIYRTTVQPSGELRWGFEPFKRQCLYRNDEPTGETVEASPEPFATILAPYDAAIGTTKGDRPALFLWPGAPGYSARAAYERASEGRFGLTLAP